MFCSSLVSVFLCVILFLIAMSCHCPFCVRLSHSIKRLLTYLLITETINTLFLVVNFIKCVVTEVVLFSIVTFKTFEILLGSVATHVRNCRNYCHCGDVLFVVEQCINVRG